MIEAAFRERFGRAPAAFGQAPGRVNLIGEHIDYNGGLVLPTAIDRKIQIAFAPNDDGVFRIASSRFEGVETRAPSDGPKRHWADYAAGALAAAKEQGWLKGGADIFTESDVPDGAGLSTSAALITAIFRAAAAACGQTLDPVAAAHIAQRVEIDFIGMPCGIMDQMAVGLATPGEALALDTRDASYDLITIPEGWRFEIIHSGVRRELSDGRYAERFKESERARQALGAEYLCHLTEDQTARIETLDSPLAKRVRHVVSEHRRATDAAEAMLKKDFAAFGRFMNESHASYSQDFAASTPQVDALVADAVALGAIGARLTGGGFGGCTVSLMREGEQDHWAEQLLARHPNASRV